MKFLSAFLLTVFCATIVTAAPSSSERFSFQDFALSKLIGEIENKLKDQLVDIECIRNVIEKIVDKSELKAIWDETNAKLGNLIDVEWPKCLEIEDIPEQQGCKTTVVGKGIQAVTTFVKELASESKWGLIKEIKDKVASECFGDAKFFSLEEESEPFVAQKSAEKIKCIVSAINEVLKDTDYAPIWEEYKKDLEQLHERIQECKNQSSHIEAVKCVAKEVKQGHEILAKFFANLKKTNKETYDRVKNNIKEKCFQ